MLTGEVSYHESANHISSARTTEASLGCEAAVQQGAEIRRLSPNIDTGTNSWSDVTSASTSSSLTGPLPPSAPSFLPILLLDLSASHTSPKEGHYVVGVK